MVSKLYLESMARFSCIPLRIGFRINAHTHTMKRTRMGFNYFDSVEYYVSLFRCSVASNFVVVLSATRRRHSVIQQDDVDDDEKPQKSSFSPPPSDHDDTNQTTFTSSVPPPPFECADIRKLLSFDQTNHLRTNTQWRSSQMDRRNVTCKRGWKGLIRATTNWA